MNERGKYFAHIKQFADFRDETSDAVHAEMKAWLSMATGGEETSVSGKNDDWPWWPRIIGELRRRMRDAGAPVYKRRKKIERPDPKIIPLITPRQAKIIEEFRRHLNIKTEEGFRRWHRRLFDGLAEPRTKGEADQTIKALYGYARRVIDTQGAAEYLFENVVISPKEAPVVLRLMQGRRPSTVDLLSIMDIYRSHRKAKQTK